MEHCGAEHCGAVWSTVEQCSVEHCGAAWCGALWSSVEQEATKESQQEGLACDGASRQVHTALPTQLESGHISTFAMIFSFA